MEFLLNLLDALQKSPFQATISLIIFLIALPLIIKGLRDRSSPPSQPQQTQIQIESPWLVIELNTISAMVQDLQRQVQALSAAVLTMNKTVDIILVLMRRRNRTK